MAGSSKSFRKHGTFVYEVSETVARYGTNQLTIEAMTAAGMTHAWVRIHGKTPYGAATKKVIKQFIDDVQTAGIAVAGWGWCQGDNPAADAKLALNELNSFGLADYVADIENGVNGANWEKAEITTFCSAIKQKLTGSFGVTTFPLINWHEPELMQAAIPFVDMFNPQVYWHHFPSTKMVNQFKRPSGATYAKDSAPDYADLCLDLWDKLIGAHTKDLVIAGQAYWGEGEPPFSQDDAEEKLDEFLAGWQGYSRVIGLNWWHFGGGQSMSHRMRDSINKAKLGAKTYKP